MNTEETPVTPVATGEPHPSLAVITPATEDPGTDNAPTVSERHETPPRTRDAIDAISAYEFDPGPEEATEEHSEEEAIAVAMMFNAAATSVELPKLRTEKWEHANEKLPNPISIGTAKKLLGAAYAEVPCELEAAKDHGYAWIIEDGKTWLARGDGVEKIVPPTKPKEVTSFVMKEQFEYMIKSKRYTMYRHLCQEGKTKIQEWFGRDVFLDLFKEGVLPPAVTPKEMLAHITTTYATPHSNRIYMEKVEEHLNGPYDPKESVEAYFLRLQEAKAHAKMLGIEYTPQQVMNKALKQFEVHYSKDAHKAERKWNAVDKQTWSDFKVYWKEQIHQWDMYATRGTGSRKEAHQAVDVASLAETVSALQAEARTLQRGNAELVKQLNFHQAMQAEHRAARDDDTVSTLTNQILGGVEKELGRKLADISFTTGATGTNSSTSTRGTELLHMAKNRNPKDTSHLNDGQGRRFTSYCWKCGCNCTHWTRKCLELSGNDRKKYKDADFDNLMGGSTKFLDRRGKFQKEFGFDSL
jgi:hypothetical protein